MSEKKPEPGTREQAVREQIKGHLDHERKSGREPNTREIEKFHTTIAEKVDREKGW